jgi:Uma2 family endonuclease
MSTIEQRQSATLPVLIAGQALGQEEFHRRYEAMPPETRAELVGGVVYMPSPMRSEHSESSPDVIIWLGLYRHRTPGVRLAENATVILGKYGEPQPDALLRIEPVLGGRCTVNEDGYLTGPPELVVEVSKSSRRFDLGAKLADYERAGVQEYVVVALVPDEVFWHVSVDGRFVRMAADADGLFRSRVFHGLWLDPAALLAGDLDALIATLDRGLATPEHEASVAQLIAARADADVSH